MPLFKVVGKDLKRRFISSAKNLDDLKSHSAKTLNRPPGEYKIVLEEDGCEIPDTETLQDYLHTCNNKAIKVMILKNDEQWSESSILNQAAATSTQQAVVSSAHVTSKDDFDCNQQTIEPNLRLTSTASSEQSLPWSKLPRELIKFLDDKKKMDPFNILLIHEIAKYLVDCNKCTSTDVEMATDEIFKTYSVLFTNSDKKLLDRKIYRRIRYCKSKIHDFAIQKKKFKQKKKNRKHNLCKKNPRNISNMQIDQPLLITHQETSMNHETATPQNLTTPPIKLVIKKPKSLCSQNKKVVYINTSDEYSLMKNATEFLKYASVQQKVPNIYDYMIQRLAEKLVLHDVMNKRCFDDNKSRKLRNSSTTEIKQILDDSEEVSEEVTDFPRILAMFPLIVFHFNEELNLFYKFVNIKNFDDEAVEKNTEYFSPILLINGNSLFDVNASCAVIILKKIFCIPENILKGFIITSLSYNIFNINYPPGLARTLDYIQKIILENNSSDDEDTRIEYSKRIRANSNAILKLDELLYNYGRENLKWDDEHFT